jgi:hypothetical protein
MRLIPLRAISLFVCPLAAGGFGLEGASAQIAFTPNIATLGLTRTVECLASAEGLERCSNIGLRRHLAPRDARSAAAGYNCCMMQGNDVLLATRWQASRTGTRRMTWDRPIK